MRLNILVPTRGHNTSEFTQAYAALCAQTAAVASVSDFQLGLTSSPGTYIHDSRNELVRRALEDGATHMLWLDDDMTFPPNAAFRLLKHDVPIVGCNYSTRTHPLFPVAIKHTGLSGDSDPTRLDMVPSEDGLAEVEGIGFGCVLTKREVFEKIEFPWFENYYDEEHIAVGEDVDFCSKAIKAGFRIMVDTELSEEIGHVGTFPYKLEHIHGD